MRLPDSVVDASTRMPMVTYAKAIAVARDLVSESGENPEYDRALCELIGDLFPGEPPHDLGIRKDEVARDLEIIDAAKPCIERRGLGFKEIITFRAWTMEVVQDEQAAIETAEQWLGRGSEDEFPWNEDARPEFYEEWFITDLPEFKRALAELKADA